jgi:hypothetical protein
LKIKIEGFITEVKLAANQKGEVVTDAYLSQGENIIRCRWKGDTTQQVKSGVRAEVIGQLVNWLNQNNQISRMVLCS